MGSEQQPLRNSGIYHFLPQFDPSIKDLTAFVTGANGISGFYTLRALLDSPKRWARIYALSRSPPPPAMMKLLTQEQRAKVEHIACDFLKDPKDIAETISKSGVKNTYFSTHISHHSTARLTGYLSEWAVLEPKCANQAFNSQDTSPLSFDRFFERLAEWFHVAKGVQPPPDTDDKSTFPIVLTDRSGAATPMGYGPLPHLEIQLLPLLLGG